ncbi:MAG: hypothetical protein ICV87_02270 [Gemmatimonadetes bacterium]|nr:hypothetical protein [Gemmatimonadota bacterium]
MTELEKEIQERVAALTPAEQRGVLEYVRNFEPMTGEEWLRGLPIISEEFAQELRDALEESRRVDPRGW